MTGAVEVCRDGATVARSRNLRALLRYRSPVTGVAIWPAADGTGARLVVVYADGAEGNARFASATVCAQWCARRRSWPAAEVIE